MVECISDTDVVGGSNPSHSTKNKLSNLYIFKKKLLSLKNGHSKNINENMYNLKKMKTLKTIRLSLDKLPIKELDYYGKIQHRRLKIFHIQGTKCVACNRIGTKLLINKSPYGTVHADIFTDDDVMMTIDHIIPKSKGGTWDIDNLQIMCTECNVKKGNTIE